MKKMIFVVSLLFLFAVVPSYAQDGFGIKAGLTFNKLNDVKIGNSADYNYRQSTGYSFGVLYKIDLFSGLALQPELLYTEKRGKAEVAGSESSSSEADMQSADFSLNYLQLPVGIQYGLDLMLIRPFIQVVPYVGYAIGKGSSLGDADWNDVKRFSYGIGLGGGLDVWKLQINGRYCWDLGNSIKSYTARNVSQTIRNGKNKGFELSLAFIF